MADSKVSELASATSAGGSDVLYLVQSNTSKKITIANLFGDISNPTLTGNVVVGGTPQTLSAPGIISITTPITHLSVDGVGGTLQIPQGSSGQIKVLTMTASQGGTYTLSTSNVAGNVSLSFNSIGDTAVLVFTNGKWFPVDSTSGISLTSISSNVIPSANSVYDLGSATNQWKSLYVSNNTIYIGGTPVTVVNGELVVGSGEASANLATVAYVDGAVANAGGGDVSTADLTTANVTEFTNLYFTNARSLAALTTSDAIAIESTADNIEITANADVSIVALDDLRLTGNDTVALRNRSSSASIDIITDYDGNQYTWEFGYNGTLITAGDIQVVGDITGTDSSSTLYLKAQPDSNTFIQLNNSVDSSIRTQSNLEIRTNGTDPLTWVFDTNGLLATPGDISVSGDVAATGVISSDNGSGYQTSIDPDSITAVYNGDTIFTIDKGPGGGSINTVEDKSFFITTDDNNNLWEFSANSTLTLPGNLLFASGCTFSEINSVSNSSGDGIGASTLQIVPDNTLFNNDQYIIIDPTEPDHIHIRGGGAIDNCSAKLIIGGENSHFAVQAGANSSVSIRANNNNWNFYTNGTLSFPDSSIQTGAAISIDELKALVANAATYGDFQTAIANL